MPMHDWDRVEAGIYHHFHHEWISEISRFLNRGLLPPDHYAMAEQIAAGFGPDVLTLQDVNIAPPTSDGGTATQTRTRPKTAHYAEVIGGAHRRRKSLVAVRHISGDRIVAMIEIVSPGNKNSNNAMHAFVEKACDLINKQIHLMLLDPFPPGRRDPNGIHAAIWSELTDESFVVPAEQPLTLVAYESAFDIRAYIETIAVGDLLPDMPLFLAPEFHIMVPLEVTYQSAWETVPARWQRVIANPSNGS
jgi:Protein of unknown function (DUF4058)